MLIAFLKHLIKEEVMRKPARFIATTTGAVLLIGSTLLAQAVAAEATLAETGKAVAENRTKGNCFACHDYPGAVLPGNVGPKLMNMKARFPDKAKLRAQIFDATKNNPNTIMPPFGKHRILTEQELDAVVEWVLTL
jgi:sulfur-oxidizing protein SoxX